MESHTLDQVVWGTDNLLYFVYHNTETDNTTSHFTLYRLDTKGNLKSWSRQSTPIDSLTISPTMPYQAYAAYTSYPITYGDIEIHHYEEESVFLLNFATGELKVISQEIGPKDNLQWEGHSLYFESDFQTWHYDTITRTLSMADSRPAPPITDWKTTLSPDGQWATQFTCTDTYQTLLGINNPKGCREFSLTLTTTATQAEQWRITQDDLIKIYGIRKSHFAWADVLMGIFMGIGVFLVPALIIPSLWARGPHHIARTGVVIIGLYYGLLCVLVVQSLLD